MWCLLSVIVPAPSGVVTFFVSFVSTNWEVRKFPNPFSNIELYEFSSGWAAIAGVDHSVAVGDVGVEALVGARTRTSSSVDLMVAMALCGAWANRPDHAELIERAFTRLAGATGGSHGGVSAWVDLRHYPILLGTYAAGIGAVHAKNWNAISRVLATGGTTSTGAAHNSSVAVKALSWTALSHESIEVHNGRKLKTPVSTYVHGLMAETLLDVLRIEPDHFENLFDEWEFLLHVTASDQHGRSPYGRWAWRSHWWTLDAVPRHAVDSARESLISVGFFDEADATGDSSRFDEVVSEHLDIVTKSGVRY